MGEEAGVVNSRVREVQAQMPQTWEVCAKNRGEGWGEQGVGMQGEGIEVTEKGCAEDRGEVGVLQVDLPCAVDLWGGCLW